MAQSDLVRKQFLIREAQARKLDRLAREEGVSAAEIVRRAIDAYGGSAETPSESELLELVGSRVREALKTTRRANREVTKALAALDKIEGAA